MQTPTDQWIDAKKQRPDKANTVVWIFDEYYHGVTLGIWVGWWETLDGSDDISVSHWMPLSTPEAP